jgi:hypothetical protein
MQAIVDTTSRWISCAAHAPTTLRIAVASVCPMSDHPSAGAGLETSIATSTP